jgi:integrase
MAVYVRPYVVGIDHVVGCTKRRCGPECRRKTEGWEYEIKMKLPNGKFFQERRKSSLASKTNTARFAEERALFVTRESVIPVAVAKKVVPTVADFEKQFMVFSKTNNKPSTVYAKEWMLRVHVIPYFGSKTLDQIGPADIEDYKAKKLDEGCEKKSINNHITTLRKLLNLALEWGVVEKVAKVKAFRLKTNFVTEDMFLGFDEAERFIKAAPAAWLAFMITAIKTGLRLGELLALKWEDIDLVSGQLVVRRTLWRGEEGPPKGGKNRIVPLSDEAIATLKGHRAATLLKSAYVFCDGVGDRLTHSMLKDVVPKTCLKAGLGKRITTHGLRHSFASHLVMRGVSLKAVQELLGHESIEMTLRYSHLSPDVKRDAVKLLDTKKLGDIRETGA